ncbi:substrate-binding domain-containing protein [Labrys miyagiensis]
MPCFSAAQAQQLPDLVDTRTLRVCSDPENMPFSNRKKEGFENRIADIIGDELKRPVRYYWLQQGPGFVRNTLATGLCDVIIGYASGSDIVQHTNPYYASTYVLVVKASGPLAGVKTLEDPRLKGRKLGVIAATPTVDHLLRLGMIGDAKTYDLLVDRRYESPTEDAIADLAAGTIDGALLWGPNGGYYARKSSVALEVIPLVHETERPPLAYRITMGVRGNETAWKHTLNDVIRKRQKDIDKVLQDFNVPLVPVESLPSEASGLAAGPNTDSQE